MNSKERIQELAALNAAGALEGEDAAEFRQLLEAHDPDLLSEIKAYSRVAEALATSAGAVKPSAGLKARLLESIAKQGVPANVPEPAPVQPTQPELPPGFMFLKDSGDQGWLPLPVKGAWVKPLRIEVERGYAMVLGKLDPGTHYPAHRHQGPEQIYMLSGDLHIGDQVLGPGDFHHAEAATHHDVNHSVHGCTILLVLSIPDLQAQMA